MPDGALSVLRRSPEDFAEEMKRAAVAKWYEMGTVSQSMGAEILGVSRAEFMRVLSQFRVAAKARALQASSPVQTSDSVDLIRDDRSR